MLRLIHPKSPDHGDSIKNFLEHLPCIMTAIAIGGKAHTDKQYQHNAHLKLNKHTYNAQFMDKWGIPQRNFTNILKSECAPYAPEDLIKEEER